MAAWCMVLLAQPLLAQGWQEYENRVDRFTVPAPGEPKIETITWDSEYGAKFPGRVYRWGQGRARYSVTVVDYSDAERIHSELGHIAYQGGPGYWTIDIMASIDYAAMLYRQKPGVKVTVEASGSVADEPACRWISACNSCSISGIWRCWPILA